LTIKAYDPIITILRSTLLANNELVSGPSWTVANTPDIYPDYIDSVNNPSYPSLTICKNGSETLKNRSGYEEHRYYIHGWVKQATDGRTTDPPNDIAYLYNLVVATLDVDPILGQRIPQFAMCRKIDGRCPLYDEVDTRTTYFMTEWLIKASKSLMNA
jgi:hypothetical protein